MRKRRPSPEQIRPTILGLVSMLLRLGMLTRDDFTFEQRFWFKWGSKRAKKAKRDKRK